MLLNATQMLFSDDREYQILLFYLLHCKVIALLLLIIRGTAIISCQFRSSSLLKELMTIAQVLLSNTV